MQDLWIALNAEFGLAPEENGKVHKAPGRVRSCRICHKANKGLMQCGGGCKQFVHANCAGISGREQVQPVPFPFPISIPYLRTP